MDAFSVRLARSFPIALFAGLSAAEVNAIRARTQGAFTYSLDDPYIHLALAENIARGTYGINLGEVSAPSSSMIWPFLLAPLATTSFAHLVPLALNLLSSALTLWLAHRFLRVLFVPNSLGDEWLIAGGTVVFFLCTNLLGLAFTGMEHSLQVLGVLALLSGAKLEEQDGRLRSWAVVALTLLPMVRYETLVLTGPMLVYFLRRGHGRTACLSGAATAVCLGLFSGWLRLQGLGFLPTSVEAKSNLGVSPFERASTIVLKSWEDPHIALFFLFAFGFVLLALLLRSARERELALVLAVATLGHLYIGNFGWFDRYEIYLFVAQVLGLTWLLEKPVRSLGDARALRTGALLVTALVMASGSYLVRPLQTPAAARNIYEQQFQMHRFAVELYRKPIAVNDIGFVSFRNDAYVLDMVGLASRSVLHASRSEAPRVWRERFVREHGIDLAMIYHPGSAHIPESWIPLGALVLGGPLVTAAFQKVEMFATHDAAVDELRPLLARFRANLPEGVTFAAPDANDLWAKRQPTVQ